MIAHANTHKHIHTSKHTNNTVHTHIHKLCTYQGIVSLQLVLLEVDALEKALEAEEAFLTEARRLQAQNLLLEQLHLCLHLQVHQALPHPLVARLEPVEKVT